MKKKGNFSFILIIIAMICFPFFIVFLQILYGMLFVSKPILAPFLEQNMSGLKGPLETSIFVGILTLISLIIWFIFGRDAIIKPIPTAYPSNEENSAEFEINLTETSTKNGVLSLIFYLASKGYIEIEDNGVEFVIKKLKPYDGNKASERTMMDALFSENKDIVTQSELELDSTFILYCHKIQSYLNRIRSFLFEKDSCSIPKMIIMILSVLGLLTVILYTFGDYSFMLLQSENAFLLLFPLIAIMVLIALLSSKKYDAILFGIVWALCFGGIPFLLILPSIPNLTDNIYLILFELACIIISIICLINMPKRNKKGRITLGQILGLKKYIEVAEKPRLIALLRENPNYISEILPFAYVLGVENHLLECIENYQDLQPTWYHGSFNRHNFSHLANTIQTAATPSSSSGHHGGSGFSGGGHSGGGHGGGGGSW